MFRKLFKNEIREIAAEMQVEMIREVKIEHDLERLKKYDEAHKRKLAILAEVPR